MLSKSKRPIGPGLVPALGLCPSLWCCCPVQLLPYYPSVASKAAFTDPSPGTGDSSSIILSQRLSHVLPLMLGSSFPKTPAKSLCNFFVFFPQAFLFTVMAAGTWQQAQFFFLSSVFCSLALPLPLSFGCGQEGLSFPAGAALVAHEARSQ